MFKRLNCGFLILLILSLLSCDETIGYGVVKISEDQNILENGTLLEIKKESIIRDTWVYNTDEEEHIEIQKWRVADFNNKEDAIIYLKEYNEFKNYYAVVVNKNYHTMRQHPINTTPTVYRLKENQRTKILGRTKEKEKIAGFNGYWWKLITDDGIEGWAYDSYMNIYDGDKLIHGKKVEERPEIDNFFNVQVWRPDYFSEMIRDRNINLDKFKAKFGLIPDLDNKEITISLPDNYYNGKFTDITKIGDYSYLLEGANIELDFSYKDMVFVAYTQDYKSYYSGFLTINGNINDIINGEVSRRNIIYKDILLKGSKFNSKAYGEIIFNSDKTFLWENKDNLVSKGLITSNARDTGSINFKIFLSNQLKAKYDGAITFDFGDRQELTFLYTLEDEGIRFIHVPPSKIKDSMINSDESYSPTVLYFSGE